MPGVIVCGGRHFNRYDVVEKVLNEVLSTCGDQEIEIVSGHCEGADALGERYAEEHGVKLKIFPADWKKYGRSAGPIRNKQMIDYIIKLDKKLVVAFVSENSRGTKNTITLAGKEGIPVIEIKYKVINNEVILEGENSSL